jgi:hypothetical protein
MQNNTLAIRKDLLIGVLVGIIILLVGYIILNKFQTPAVITEVSTTTQEQQSVSDTPTEQSPGWSIVSDGPNIKRFYWSEKGLSFNYSPFVYLETEEYFGPDLEHLIADPTVDVAGRIVFPRGSLEVFDKEATETPEHAIRTRFLNGINTPTCVVKRAYPNDEDFIYLTDPNITYVRMKGSGCPAVYRSDDSISTTFFVLTAVPDKLFFVTTNDGENVSLRTQSGAPFFASFAKMTSDETEGVE